MLKLLVFLLLVFTISCESQVHTGALLVQNSQSDYEIYVPSKSNTKLLESVKEFQFYIHKITGAKLPIVRSKNSNYQIVIGEKFFMEANKIDLPFEKIKDDGFVIKIQNNNIFISGLSQKGVINGIYTFLTEYLGCKYYTRNEIYVPNKHNISFQSGINIQNPAFQTRIINAYQGFSPTYCRWHKLDFPPKINRKWLKPWVHTTLKYVNPRRYKKESPEYFTYIEGELIDINYDNPQVLKKMISKIEKQLLKTPHVEYVSASQADISHNLKNVKDRMNSSLTLRFANNVAKRFPQKTITYLAYQYSMMPPKDVKPLDNVLVIIPNTLNYRNIAVNLRSPKNQFAKALKDWQKLTDNIMVWDYITNTKYPFSPHPNFKLMQKAMINYKNFHVSKIFVGGEGQPEIGFQALRNYLMAKLLWNPNINIDSVIDEFLFGYYGDAAPYIKKYILSLTDKFSKSRIPLSRKANPIKYENKGLSHSAIQEYKLYFKEAKDAVKRDSMVWKKIDKLQQSLRFAQLEVYRNSSNLNKKKKIQLLQKNIIEKKSRSTNKLSEKEYENLLEEFIQKSKEYGMNNVNGYQKFLNSTNFESKNE